MFLIVGLGNPGSRYLGSRHNVGFQVVDRIAASGNATFAVCPGWRSERACIGCDDAAVTLIKPLTFMNLSGMAVLAANSDLMLPYEQIIVVHDDLDLAPGRLKLAVNRGNGGHNGIRSIIDHLKSRAFIRLRLGIGRPVDGENVSDFVLSPFLDDEKRCMDKIIPLAAQAVLLVINEGLSVAMNRVNQEK